MQLSQIAISLFYQDNNHLENDLYFDKSNTRKRSSNSKFDILLYTILDYIKGNVVSLSGYEPDSLI